MFIIKSNGRYVVFVLVGENKAMTIHYNMDRDNAKQFKSRQEAKDFMAEHSITGSIIPY